MPQFRRRALVPALAVLLVVVPACSQDPDPADPCPEGACESQMPPTVFPLTLTDDDGVEVTLDGEPQRIVTFAPSITELVFALGAGDRLVGVSGEYDDYPPEAASIEHIGGAGEFGVDPNVEEVVALEPDLFLTIKGGDAWKERLREVGVPVFTLNAEHFDDLVGDIATLGSLLGEPDAAAALRGELTNEAAEVTEPLQGVEPVSCFFEVYYGPPVTTVGPNTYLADLLRMAGCDLVSGRARTDYPSWSVERLVASSPEVYLATDESVASLDALAERPGYDAIAAVAEGRVHLVDSDLVSRAGPRVVEGLRALAEALHPDVFAAA